MPEGTVGQIGRYKVVDELGRGGFGCVYLGFDASVGRQVAIKVLTEGGKELLARFRNEAQVAGNLRHENIVTVYEYGEHEGRPFLAMEYLDGEDLQHILATHKPLTLLQKCSIMAQAAEGLYCAHRNGVVHRDVKPANIMVRPDGRVKIMDFGIARVTQGRDATRLTQEGWMIGTLLYMAPEQFGGAEVDALSDIFAYGVVFYELLTGRHPFEAPDSRNLMYKISFAEPPPIRNSVPECPEALERIILRLLAKERELRYQSLKDVLFDIEGVRIDLGRQRSEELLREAQVQLQKNEPDSAQSLVIEALGLDPSNRVARGLRETLQKQLQHRALLPRIESLMNSAENHLEQRHFQEAVHTFETARRLDPENGAIQGRLDHARTLLEHGKAAESLIAEARKELEKHNLTVAQRTVSEALRHDPQNPLATELLDKIQHEIDRRQKEQRIEETLHRAEGLILLHSYEEAIDLLTGLGVDAESPKVQRLLNWLRTEKAERERKDRLQAEMAAVTDQLRLRRLDEAVERLEAIRREYPNEQEVANLLAYARKEREADARAQAVQELLVKAGALSEAKDFDPALALLEKALKQYPGETALIRILGSTMATKASWERQQAVDNALRQGAELRRQQRFAEAIELVEATLRDHSSDPALLELLEQLEQDWARKRRAEAVRKAVEQAEQMLGRKQPHEAQQHLRQGLIQYPGEAALADLLKRADEELRAIEKARAIEAIVREARARAEARDYTRALSTIDLGLQTWSAERQLLDLRKEIADAEKAWRRRKEIEAAIQGASSLAAGLKFEEALALIAESTRKFPGEKELDELQARIARDWEQHKRREAVRGVASEARLLLSRGRLEEANDVLNEGLARYPGEGELEAASRQVREAIRVRERERAIAKLIGESKDFAAAHRFDEARRVLENGLGAFPAEQAILRQLDSVKAAAREWEREQAIARTVAEAGRLAGEKRFDDALDLLARTAASSPALAETRRRIEREREDHKRREAVEKGAAEAAALLQSGRSDAAVKLLEELSSRYSGEKSLEPALQRARQAVAERKAAEERRKAVEETIRECGRLAGQGRFDAASERLAGAFARFPDDPSLLQLQERLGRARQEHERAQAIARDAAQGGSLLDSGRLEEALAFLTQACATYPGEASLRSLLARGEKELAARQELERAKSEGSGLIEQQRFEEAIQAMERALAAFPGNPELVALAARAREALEARRREETVTALLNDARALAGNRDFEHALSIVERGLKNWPGDKRLFGLRRSIQAEQKQSEREQARKQILDDLQRLAREQRFAEARKRAEEALASYADDPDLVRLRNDCEMREILAQAAAAAAQGRPQDGLRMLQDPAGRYASHPEWKALLDRLREQVAAAERQAAIRRTAEEALRLANSADFGRALKLLDDAALQLPGEAALDDARRSVMDLKKAHDRKTAIQTAAAGCVRLAEQGRLQDALEQTAKALREFPDDPTLTQLRRRFDEQRQVEEQRRQRQSDLEELRGLDASIARADGSGRLAELRGVAERILAQYPGDDEIRSAAARPLRHLSDIESAANALRERNFDAALQVCGQYLALYPEHVRFRALQTDAERGRRAADLEGIRRRAEREADLAARAAILEEALGRYPDEAWIARELRLTRNKLDLAQSIIAQARAHEAAGAWDLALEQWNKLATIYEQFPGLAQEIDRVRAASQRAKVDAVAQWAGQIEPLINSGQLAKARELLLRALSELPDAAPLRELLRKLDELREKQRRIRDFLGGLRGLRERGKWEEFDQQAAEALRLTADDAALRKTVLEKLVEHARAVADSDWTRAEALIALVRSADPAHPVPQEVLHSIAKGRRAAAIDAALRRAGELQAGKDPRGALASLDQALREYPDDSRLQAARRAIDERLQKDRARFREELRQIQAAAQRAAQVAELDPLNARVASIASEVQPDAELAAMAAETARAIAARRRQLGRARVAGILGRYRKQILIAGAAAAALLAGMLGIRLLLTSSRRVSVTIASDTAGASVTVGALQCLTPQCVLKLPAGSYTLTAAKDGFRPISQPLSVSSGETEVRVPLAFEPLPEELQINTNFESGRVFLDGRPAAALRDGQFSISGLAPGRHTVRVTGGDAEFSAQWQSSAGARPELIGGVSAKNVGAAIIANVGGDAAIACNCDAGPVLVDGSPAGQTVSGAAAPLAKLRQGQREISVAGRSVVMDVRPNPAVNVFLALDRDVGVLVVNAGQDEARVYLNNRLYGRRTEQGVVRIPVPVGDYSVRVEKDNFRGPAAQTASVAKGEEKQIRFTLSPATAVLEITGAQPHAQVKIDDRSVGETDAGGHLRAEVPAGAHSVELSKDGFGPVRWETQFDAGAQLRPSPAQVAMAKLPPPPTPEPRPVDTEAQDWARVSNSARIEDLQDYIRKHPNGAHERDAQSRVDQLRQADAARKEQADWDAVDKSNKVALEDYLARHAGGPHVQDARASLDAIQKREAGDSAAAEREKLEKQAEQERAAKAAEAAEAQAILRTLADYEAAYNNKDLQAMALVYNPLPAGLSADFKQYKSVSFQIRATEQPVVNGDSATVACTRSLSVVAGGGHYTHPAERVRAYLVRTGSRWTIREISKF